MDSTSPNPVSSVPTRPSTQVIYGTEWATAEELHHYALSQIEHNTDVTIDFEGLESLDAATLQVLLALSKELQQKNLRLIMIGISPSLLRWFGYAGAQKCFPIENEAEGKPTPWN